MSGESVVCKRTLENSVYCYDVCCGLSSENYCVEDKEKIQIFPLAGKYITWPFRVLYKFLKLDKQRNYKVMMSRVMPPNGHLAGLLIKLLRPKIKWIAYFSDPIWNSPFISFSSMFQRNARQTPNYILMKVLGIPSWLALRLADLLVFNNERLAKYILGKRYNQYKDKIVIASYGHDGVKKIEKKDLIKPDNKITIAHIGQIYGARSFQNVIQALELLKKRNFEQYNKIKLLQVGFICGHEKEMIMKSNVSDSFQFVDEVSYEESLKYMRNADYALILDPCFYDDKKNMYVPVKIYDYMSVGAEIMAIADKNSATADIASQIGCLMVAHDSKEIARMLLECTRGQHNVCAVGYEKFHCRQGVAKLDARIAQMLNEV